MTTKDVIAQAEKRFEERFVKMATDWRENNGWTVDYVNSRASNIKEFIESYTKDLLQSVVEMAGGMKKKTIENMLQEDELFNEKGIDGVRGYNQALSDIITNIQKE